MKTQFLLLFSTCFAISNLLPEADAQGTWTSKTDFGGTARYGAVGFSIGTKGYIGTGSAGSYSIQDFWEWDGDTNSVTYNTWTQKADFGGGVRIGAVGFSIGTKGYIGTGNSATGYKQDFWEWDGDVNSPTYNTWIQKADFAGTPRLEAVCFSIGNKGYIGTGWDNTNANKKDFWEWDQSTNVWTQKTDFGGTGRRTATGFSIGTKGYIGTGQGPVGTEKKDFWEYDPGTNTWIQKADFGGTARHAATGLSIGTKGYIGTGYQGNGNTKDFWEYDPAANTWIQKADFIETRNRPVSFSIGTRGYMGTGWAPTEKKDFWEFLPEPNTNSMDENEIEVLVAVFPNPFSYKTTFTLSKEIKNASLKLFDISGKEVMQDGIAHKVKNHILERKNLESGIYFFQIISGNKAVSCGKLIIQ